MFSWHEDIDAIDVSYLLLKLGKHIPWKSRFDIHVLDPCSSTRRCAVMAFGDILNSAK